LHDQGYSLDESSMHDAILAGAVFAADAAHVGGIILRADSGPIREDWLRYVLSLLPLGMPVRRIPAHISDERLLGGLDLAATLATGRPVAARGLLQECDRGIVIIPGAERLAPALASRLAATMDLRAIALQRDGFDQNLATEFGFIALDEGRDTDECPPSVLLDRAALHITIPSVGQTKISFDTYTRERVNKAERAAKSIHLSDDILRLFCQTASLLGVSSSNALLQAARISRILAALDGRDFVSEDDVAATIRLVIAPRATQCHDPGADDAEQAFEPRNEESKDNAADGEDAGRLPDAVVAATKAALPPHLLEQLRARDRRKVSGHSTGRLGEKHKSPRRGRPAGAKSGSFSKGARLNIVETLRASAPWQTLRRRELGNGIGIGADYSNRIEVRSTDFRICKMITRGETVTVFVVDASGSTAAQRLGEAKGAVEILLSECYSRRDHAALIAFSGRGSELLLPPTRSLARAKRNLADLPGGGGTPLASGISTAVELCDAVRRKGQTPSVVLLTDGRANLGRDGKPGRSRAEDDAIGVARLLRRMEVPALLIDTSARPNGSASRLADAMGAKYLPLAYADAGTLAKAVKSHDNRSGSP